MSSKIFALLMILIVAFAGSGCGDLKGTKVVKRKLDGSQFEVQCQLDINKFSDIMRENIESQIRCLGDNLNLFIRVVKSGKPGYLSRVQLESYLAKYRPDVKPEVIKALKSMFDLGHLITGEDPDYISKDTVDKVISFAIVFNKEAALNFEPIFQNESPVTYALHQNHRERVSAANKSIIGSLRNIFNPNRNGQVHKLNIISLLDSFSTESTRDIIEKARKVLFIKKVLLGGDNEIITHLELEKLLLNFDQLLLIGLDITRYKYILLDQKDLLHLLRRDVNDLNEIVNQGPLENRDDQTLFTINEAIEAAKLFVDREKFDIDKFRNLIGEAKVIAMNGNKERILGKELKELFRHGKSLLQTGNVFHRIYEKFKAQLDGPRPVEETIDFNEYRYTYPEHQAELDQFERITKKYRFMKGEFFSSFYTRGFRRNADAVFEVAVWEYIIKLLFKTYGDPSPTQTVGGYSIDKVKMQKLLVKFEPELIELDLIYPGRALNTADNISLLGTLFQYQSDKNKVMDVNEASEFAVSLFSSINISDDLYDYLVDKKCTLDNYDRFDPVCFRKNFWKGFCTNYRSNFPLMFESLNAPKKCEAFENTPVSDKLLDKAISAARTCNYYTDGDKEEIPYSKSDFMTILLALMHAETTIIRWDLNNNNYMDEDEVNRAYDIYAPALDEFLVDKNPIIQRFRKQIYQYMIKYEQVPDEKDFKSIWKFVKFLLSFDKRVPGTRQTVVSILNVIGEQNKKISEGPVFDCNLLRKPVNLPRIDYGPYISKSSVPRQLSEEEILALLKPLSAFINTYWQGDRESLRQALITMSEDMEAQNGFRIRQMRSKALRNLFIDISRDLEIIRNLERAFPQAEEVERIVLALTKVLTL